MRFIRSAILALCFVSGASMAQSQSQLYNAEEQRILTQLSQAKIGVLDAMLEIEAAGKAYFQDDALLNARNASFVRYARQHASGEISIEQLMNLVEQRKQRFDEALAERKQAETQQQEMEMRNAQAQIDQERRNAAIGGFLQNMGNSMRRTYPQPTNCTSYPVGGQIVTNCR